MEVFADRQGGMEMACARLGLAPCKACSEFLVKEQTCHLLLPGCLNNHFLAHFLSTPCRGHGAGHSLRAHDVAVDALDRGRGRAVQEI